MQINDYNEYDWNRCVAPHGNMGNVDPDIVANLCDEIGLPWFTYGWPYSSGIKVYCESDEIWQKILREAKEQ